ncbi:MAG: sigma-70 family RNA polymerase sigma factor [Planctomycetota bacterium]
MNTGATTTSILLRQFVQEDRPDLFFEIDQRYRPILLGFARRSGFSAEESEDIAQETLMRVAKSAAQFDSSKGRLKSWLFQIARNCVVDAHRSRGRRRYWRGESAIEELALDEDGFEASWERECKATIFRLALEELRATTRTDERTLQAFERVALKQEDAEVVARELEMTAAQVYVAKSRCLLKLRPIVERLIQVYELE